MYKLERQYTEEGSLQNKKKSRFKKLAFLTIASFFIFFSFVTQAQADITTGLVGHWKFDETTGTTAVDSSSSGNNGTLINGPIWTTGKIGNALDFDGVNDYVDISSTNNIPFGSGARSISFWINTSKETADIFEYGAVSPNQLMGVGVSSSGYLYVFTVNNDAHISTAPYLSNGQWHHIGITIVGESNTGTAYIDGVSYPFNLNYVQDTQTGPFLISGNLLGRFQGLIDDVRIYNRALTQTDVTELYNYTSDIPPPTYQCSDGSDNDGDGFTDYPNDPGCASSTDNDEYNAPTGDTSAPIRSAGSPTSSLSAGTTSTALSLNTDENATCKYGVNSNTTYASIPNTFSITGGTSHTTTLTSLQNGTTYTYYIRCQDTTGNANTNDYPVNFSVASASSGGTGNWYVRPNGGTYGIENGSDWDNAFDGFFDINWSLVQPGDTIWVAGGTYSETLSPGKGGSSDSVRITMKRPLSTDSIPTSATGWNASFDSQILQSGGSIFWGTSLYENFTIDGRVTSGWKILVSGTNGNCVTHDGAISNITYSHIECQGPGFGTNFSGKARGWDITPDLPVAYRNILIDNFIVSGMESGIYVTQDNTDVVIQHGKIYDIKDADPNAPNDCCHNNIIFVQSSTNLIIRYIEFYNWVDEGIFFQGGVNSGAQIYGNLAHDGATPIGSFTSRFFECKNVAVCTNFKVYNNTLHNMWAGILFNSPSSTGTVYNNIVIDVPGITYQSGITHDYNWYSGGSAIGEPNGVAGGSEDPFISKTSNNYHLSPGRSPINTALNLGYSYSNDIDGNMRGLDGFWDIGAYEYQSGYTPPPPTTDTTAPSIPTALTATAISTSQINLSWSPSTDNTGVTGYRIYRNGTQLTTTTGTSYSNIGLSASTLYTYTVLAHDGAGNNSSQSTSASATTQAVVIADTTTPTISTIASLVTTTSATISWTTNEPADSQVEYGLTTSYGQSTTVSSTLTTSHSRTITSLSPNTTYNYRVISRDASGNTALSQNRTFQTSTTIDTNAPSAITNLTTSNISQSSLALAWTAPSDNSGVVSYDIRYSITPITDTTFSSATPFTAPPTPHTTGSVEQYIAVGLTPTTLYFFAIKSTDAVGNVSLISNIATGTTLPAPTTTSTTPSTQTGTISVPTTSGGGGGGGSYTIYQLSDITPPKNPADVRIEPTNTQATLSWSNPTDPDFVRVKIVRKTGSAVSSHTDGTVVYDGTGTTFTDTNLVNNQTYYYAIYAYDKVPNYTSTLGLSVTPQASLTQTNVSYTTIEAGCTETTTYSTITGKPCTKVPTAFRPFYTFLSDRSVTYGMKDSTDVRELQKILQFEGLLSLSSTADGSFGPITKAAIIAFQKKYTINPPQGYVGPLTKTKLNQLYGSTTSSATFYRNLTLGSKGEDVKKLQQLLNTDIATRIASTGSGSPGNETTYFGPATKSAVIKYQKKYNISPTSGYVGPLTRGKLEGR